MLVRGADDEKPTFNTDEDRWQAVLARDPRADGQFVFAVQTTGIFCRPSCRARHALRKNVRFYPDAHAGQDGFAPASAAMPDKRDPQQQKLAKWNRPVVCWSRIARYPGGAGAAGGDEPVSFPPSV
jgi:methylphosphotriester-DNA--protein-cysteine methyltransferase